MSGMASRFTAARVKRVAVGTAKGAGIGIAAFAFGAMIFWDADLFAARDKWEHTKIALFGEWHPGIWCPPGRGGGKCRGADTFRERLSGMEGLTFFLSERVEGTDLDVTTGIRFASADDVVAGKPDKHWCYIDYGAGVGGTGALTRKLTLATKAADELAVPADLSSLTADDLTGTGLSSAALQALVASHCRFEGGFDAARSSNHKLTGE